MALREFTKHCLFSSLRMAFRLTPMPVATRDRLRQRFLDRHSDLLPSGPRGQISDSAKVERRPRVRAAGRAIGYVPHRAGELPAPMPATLIAFYLPQFHSIPENDQWWGKGFTEWNNVTRALPQFEGHAQPRLPGELGFYDLHRSEVMRQQMQLAREYGVGAFCSYFYWFAGKTLLEAPLQQWLADPTLDLPICLCWANENWSRRWDGRADDILISQQHSPSDDLAFIAYVARYLADPRYLRVEGKPLLLVYRPGLLPDPKATAQRWREWCRANGIGEIQLAYVQSFDRVDPRTIGFDAAVEFPPNNTTLKPITARQHLLNPDFHGDVYDWRELAQQAMATADPTYPLYPCVNPSWDNEPRRSGAGRIFAHASPRGYRDWLRHAIATAGRRAPTHPLVFINAWNEWAEGAVLEPDARLGCGWLEATRQALCLPTDIATRPCAVVHVWYPEMLDELVAALHRSGINWRIIITTAPEREVVIRKRITELKLGAEVAVFTNHGRDILPFLHVANRLLDEGVEVVLKLHSKHSNHRENGDAWRRELLGKLLSPEYAKNILATFNNDPSLGLVYAEGHLQPQDGYWGANKANVEYLGCQLGLPESQVQHGTFVAGSMFWSRLKALQPLLDAHLNIEDFEPESAQVDGTLAHAVERLFASSAEAGGFRLATTSNFGGSFEPRSKIYPYARRSS
ncbi:MAG: glycoside hydrolase family 99-like domain-containing protein [Rhodanobacter sp.]